MVVLKSVLITLGTPPLASRWDDPSTLLSLTFTWRIRSTVQSIGVALTVTQHAYIHAYVSNGHTTLAVSFAFLLAN